MEGVYSVRWSEKKGMDDATKGAKIDFKILIMTLFMMRLILNNELE